MECGVFMENLWQTFLNLVIFRIMFYQHVAVRRLICSVWLSRAREMWLAADEARGEERHITLVCSLSQERRDTSHWSALSHRRGETHQTLVCSLSQERRDTSDISLLSLTEEERHITLFCSLSHRRGEKHHFCVICELDHFYVLTAALQLKSLSEKAPVIIGNIDLSLRVERCQHFTSSLSSGNIQMVGSL